MEQTVLLVDDEAAVRATLRCVLEHSGYNVVESNSCSSAEQVYGQSRPHAAILDYCLPDGNGVQLLHRLKKIDFAVPMIMLTGFGTVDMAVDSMKCGAEHVLVKPTRPNTLLAVLDASIRRSRSGGSVSFADALAINPFTGVSESIRELAKRATIVAASDAPVVIEGETGTGKSLLAHWIHLMGKRRGAKFVDLNCTAIATDLLESELFGHERGAFTSAVGRKIGLFEVANRGTLLLDEIGDMPIAVQGKLLKVLEEKRFRRLGSIEERTVDMRLISATHRDLVRMLQLGHFRVDLYYRLSVLGLSVPPLRERPEDIPLLARSIANRLCKETGRSLVGMAPAALRKLALHDWPGNVRELRNVLYRAIIFGRSEIQSDDIIFLRAWGTPVQKAEGVIRLAELERMHIKKALQSADGKVGRAARLLGIPTSTLYQKLNRLQIAK